MNPITLRQSFQTANLEALREAQGFNDLLAREAAHKRILDDRTAQEQNNVPEIPRADALRTEERKGRQGREDAPEQGEAPEAASGEDLAPERAIPAEGGLDLLV
ncbi:hypothetical protein [Mesoterricola sediminis]|uniref:Uncharacterized protein n=1 Tax=Mesoterricola sediminis TaxID=2927980 RepID=A0AA48KEC7_9BACT|nr:hypothetical protein [Mesoterricola sediminis]BDU77197.1 hypothetical protein METESE_21550 [Mesoterricola sediminis]